MKRTVWTLACLLYIAPPVFADDLFSITITVEEKMDSFGFDNVESLFGQFFEDELTEAFPEYTENSRTAAMIDYRGLEMYARFDDNSSLLVFDVPSLDIQEAFDGANRDVSVELLEEYLESEGGDILNRIQAALIATSPVDPIAGNPNSLMGTMVAGKFRAGFQDQVTNIDDAESSASSATGDASSATGEDSGLDNLVTIGARLGRFTAAGKASNVLTLPLGYSFRLAEDGPGLRSVDISLPITYADIEGGKSGTASLGIGLTYGMNEHWSLSPAAAVGIVGSLDLGSAGGIGSVSLTSAYTIPREGWSLNIGNMVGYFETLDLSIGDIDFNPGVSNTVLRNGLMVSIPRTMADRNMVIEVWGIDTRFFGSDLYSEYYDEVGVSFGFTETRGRSIENLLRAGVSYLTGDGVEGWRFNLGYSF